MLRWSGDTLPRGRVSPSTTGKFWLCSKGRDMRNCFQYPLEGHSETSNDQALLYPFYHYIKLKASMSVGGGGILHPWVDCPHPLPQANIDYVHRDEIWEIVSTTLWPRLQCPPYHWAQGDTLTQATLSHQAKVYTLNLRYSSPAKRGTLTQATVPPTPHHHRRAKGDTLTQATLSHQAKVYTLTQAATVQLTGTL